MYRKRAFSACVRTALFLPLLLTAGCVFGKTDMTFSAFPDTIVDRAKRYVRSAKVYRDLDTILVADILWYNPELKRMHVEEMSLEGRIDDEEKRRLLAEIEAKEATEIEFLAGFYTGEKKWNDFDSSSSIWKIRLEAADGSQVAPVSVEKIDLDVMPDSYIFTFLTTWKSPYRITFEKTEKFAELKTHKIGLHSILGQAEFIWELGDEENVPAAGP